jgi:hypothetical protein
LLVNEKENVRVTVSPLDGSPEAVMIPFAAVTKLLDEVTLVLESVS